jgi:hypothetical protein
VDDASVPASERRNPSGGRHSCSILMNEEKSPLGYIAATSFCQTQYWFIQEMKITAIR